MLVATKDVATPRSSVMSSETDSEDGEGSGGGDGGQTKAGEGETGNEAVVDDRDETMGISLGPVTQGHLVGVRREHICLCELQVFRSLEVMHHSFGAIVSSATR